ncbi:urea ABC transporter permease subunit UrtC [Spongisporangium articulatum]|uniref:Urea ABC transporter permease subunit UrtC n=1 Tax=Spongisporangium articulatum TaxID=3362603 RepID=A0ABW8AGE4_9ACTN
MSTVTETAAPSRFSVRSPQARALAGFALAAVLLFAVAPAALPQFRLDLLAKYLCFGMVGIGIGLAWGRGGMLVLGQGVFFGLGGYAMAMHFKLADAAALGGPDSLPDFMQLYGSFDAVPFWWEPFRSPVVALIAVVALPMLVAFGLGSMIFRRRVRGAYFAILSQALAAALALLIVGSQEKTGGTNGLTDIQAFFGYSLDDPVNRTMIYYIAAAIVLVLVAVVRQLMQSRYGEVLVAVRDAEERVRFLGYDPANIKIFAYVVAAGMAGIGGAMFVSVVGAINPSSIGIVPSIGFVIGVAVGGRSSLLGPIVGAVAVAWASTSLSEAYPDSWNYFYGALFIVVVAFLPGGVASLGPIIRQRLAGVPKEDVVLEVPPGPDGAAVLEAGIEAETAAEDDETGDPAPETDEPETVKGGQA